MIYDNEKNRLWNLCQVSIRMVNELAKQIKKAKMTDEDFVRDWIDKLYKVVEDYDVSKAENPEQYLRMKTDQMINDISELWEQLEPYKNKQWVLDCTDELNSISVRY